MYCNMTTCQDRQILSLTHHLMIFKFMNKINWVSVTILNKDYVTSNLAPNWWVFLRCLSCFKRKALSWSYCRWNWHVYMPKLETLDRGLDNSYLIWISVDETNYTKRLYKTWQGSGVIVGVNYLSKSLQDRVPIIHLRRPNMVESSPYKYDFILIYMMFNHICLSHMYEVIHIRTIHTYMFDFILILLNFMLS